MPASSSAAIESTQSNSSSATRSRSISRSFSSNRSRKGNKTWASRAAYSSWYSLNSRDQSLELSEYQDRKSTRLNSSHLGISYAVFCLKKKKKNKRLNI